MISLNGSPVAFTIFPDETSQVWKLDNEMLKKSNYAHIVWDFSNEHEFIQLAQLKDLLDSYSFVTCLRLPYLPYGRQDKEISNSTTFALRTFAKLLNSLHFDEVIITDPHSEVALTLIKNSKAIYPYAQAEKALMETDSTLVCYPDEGARVKYSQVYGWAYFFGSKVRDPLTGRITKYELIREMGLDIRGKKIMIVDDICDGGATFILLAAELYAAGAEEVNLFVSHGLFTQGLEPLKKANIKNIFTKEGRV